MRQSREAIKGLCFCLILLTVLFLPGCIQLPAQPQAATPSPTVSPSPVSSPVPTASPAAEVAVPSPSPPAISEEAGEQVRQELSGAISGPLNYFKARFGTVEANWDKYSDERKREKLLEFCGDAVNISVLNLRVKYEYYDKGMVSLEDVVKTQDSYETVTDLCRRYSFNASLSDALPGAGVEYFEQAQAALQPENRAEIMFQVLKSVVAENEKEMTAAYAAETASLALSLTRRKTAAAAVATAYFSQAPATPPLYRVVAGKGCGFLDFTVSESSSRGRIFQYGVEVAVRGLPQGNFTCDASLVAEAVMQEKKTIPVRVSYFDADALLCSPEEKLNVFYCTYDPDNCEKGVREGFSGWDGCVKKMDELNGR
ncbi:MAG: hypothetical protein NTY90_00275, partial [Candidatus Micrarchaeota archaeon]|nr:hypothetical protein [Candidatus Micrarchaeota archaeon]